ncbi:SLAM family member 9-like [Leptodactylus fuscus]|uniref:SLAM family member 9-like n=1 Tax=Leptodactylus fuscus TaxID=238119 RepID=UPI003F4E9B72
MALQTLTSLFFLIILLTGAVAGDSCRWENVSGAAGEEVILRVHQEGIRRIHWVLLTEGQVIVTTIPGRSIDDEDVRTEYRGRVRSEADGSLHIYNLSLQDQKIYKADIRRTQDEKCEQFNLTVAERLSSGDLRITGTITRNDTCSPALLCTVDKPDVTITWRNINSSDVNVTGGVLYVPPSDVTFTYICTASNPVSNVFKTVIPKEYCNTGPENSDRQDEKLYILFITLGIIIVIIVIGVGVHYIMEYDLYRTCGGLQPEQGDYSLRYLNDMSDHI